MPKKRPTEVGWDSDEDMLLEDTGTISVFTKKYGNDEEIDEDALLGIAEEKPNSSQNKSLTGESFELFVDDKEMGTFDDTAESQELDYEDTYQEEELSQDYAVNENDLLVVSETPNHAITKIHPIKPEVFGAKTGESDNSDSDDEKKGRGRFKTERETITLKTPLFTKAAAIPDSLELTKEMQEEIDSFDQKQGKKGKNWKNNTKHNQQQKNQQQNNQQQNNQQIQQQHHHQHQFQNNIRQVRPNQHQQFQRAHRPQGNQPRRGQQRFNRPRHFGLRGPHLNFNGPRQGEPNLRNIRPLMPQQQQQPHPEFNPMFQHELHRPPHSSAGPQPHPTPNQFEKPPEQHPHPGHTPPFNHGQHQGPVQSPEPFSPPPVQSQHQSPVVHVNPNFTGPIPKEAFSHPQPQQPYPPQHQQPGPLFPTQPAGHNPQHQFHQPGMPPHSVQHHHQQEHHHQQHQQPPQHFSSSQQHFQQQQHQQPGFPPHHQPQMNFPPHQGPPHQHGQMDMPRPALLENPRGPRPGFPHQHRPGLHHRPEAPQPQFQGGPRPQLAQQHQQHMMRGQPPRPNQQPSLLRTPSQGQQIPPRFQGQGQPRQPNQQVRPQRFQPPNQGISGPAPGPRGPAPGPLQQQGGFNPAPGHMVPLQTEEERRREEQEQLQKMREMEEKKRKRAERFSVNAPVEVARTSGNLKVINTTAKLGQKRPSTSNNTEISPAKIIKIELNQESMMDLGADADLQAMLEKQKVVRERIQRQKEARRQAEAESRRQKLTEKLASEGKSIQDKEKEEKIKEIQVKIKMQQEHYQQLKQKQQNTNPNTVNRQNSGGASFQKGNLVNIVGPHQPSVGQGSANQGPQGRGRGIQGNQGRGNQGHQGRGRGNPNVQGHGNQGHFGFQGQPGAFRGRGSHSQQNVGRGNQGHRGRGSQGQHGPGRGRGNLTTGGESVGKQQLQQDSKVNVTNQQSSNRTVIAQGTGVNNMGAASEGQGQKRTVVPGGMQQRRIVLESGGPSTVCIEGLSIKPDLEKIGGWCSSIGEVENFIYKVEERKVLVRFANPGDAKVFVAKYNRYMLDLTHIKVKLVPNI